MRFSMSRRAAFASPSSFVFRDFGSSGFRCSRRLGFSPTSLKPRPRRAKAHPTIHRDPHLSPEEPGFLILLAIPGKPRDEPFSLLRHMSHGYHLAEGSVAGPKTGRHQDGTGALATRLESQHDALGLPETAPIRHASSPAKTSSVALPTATA